MIDVGKISVVVERQIGTNLDGDHASGVGVLNVIDPFEFNETGGELTIAGTTYAYLSWDEDTATIDLAGVTSAAYTDSEPVLVSPASTELIATVVVDDEGEGIEAVVSHELRPLLAEGIRVDGEGETAEITATEDGWLLTNITKETPPNTLYEFTGTVDVTGSLNMRSGSDITLDNGGEILAMGALTGTSSYVQISNGGMTVGTLSSGAVVSNRLASIEPNRIRLYYSSSLYGSIYVDSTGDMTLDSKRDVVVAGTRHVDTQALDGNNSVRATNYTILSAGSEIRMYTLGTTDFAMRILDSGDIYFPRMDFGGTGATNVRWESTGELRATSSLRANKLYRKPVDAERLTAMLDVVPQTWFDRRDSERLAESLGIPDDPDAVSTLEADTLVPLRRHAGLIAEDVHDAGFIEFCEYDGDGNLRGLAYDRIGVMWIPLVKELLARIEVLEETNP